MPRLMIPIVLVLGGSLIVSADGPITYPSTKRLDLVEVLHGVKVPDPYRWLEDDVRKSKEVADWVEEQNKVTFAYLKAIPERQRIIDRLTELWNYERYSAPFKEGGRYFYFKNDGLQNQAVLYVMDSLDGEPRVLIDPNSWSKDGTIALGNVWVSDDGKYLAYSVAEGGSDWHTIRVLEVATGRVLPDEIRWVKFSGASWTRDSKGFFYGRYDAPKAGAEFQSLNHNQKLYYHRIGTSQADDVLVYRRPDHPDWGFSTEVTEDGRYLVITIWKGTDAKYRITYKDLQEPYALPVDLIENFDNDYSFIGNDGPTFFFRTDLDAPRGRVVAIDTRTFAPPSPDGGKGAKGKGAEEKGAGGEGNSPLSPGGRGAGGEGNSPLSPAGRGAGGEGNSPLSPAGRGAGGEGNSPLSPAGRGAGGEGNSPLSPAGRGAGGEGNSPLSPAGRGAGGEGNSPLSPAGRGAGGEGAKSKALPKGMREIIPQAEENLRSVGLVNNMLVAVYLKDARTQVKLFSMDGSLIREVQFPTLGTASGFGGRRTDTETFYSFSSFATPPSIYRYDLITGQSKLMRQAKVKFNPENYEVKQVFYQSKDGTRVPMFITHRKGIKLDGSHPTLLYGYGGFNIPLTPVFSISRVMWLEMGGIYAQANLRGGGEYGKQWHQAGTKGKKQNVFDDFIAAAEWLIANKYTSSNKLAIQGGSNGGLLVGACMAQRPDLFGACLPAVGVMDMLRFHKFTAGRFWVDDYGSPDNPEEFKTLLSYSPYHNLKKGTRYPATLVTTADTDDRVIPAHSFKFIAQLQYCQAGPAPVLARIETKAGHGAGKPTAKLIEEVGDQWAFLVRNLNMKLPAGK